MRHDQWRLLSCLLPLSITQQIQSDVDLPRHTVPGHFFVKKPSILLLIALTVTGIVYLPGLWGGFLLDDNANLSPVWHWLSGKTGWLQVVLENSSGPLGRPISMLSFVATAGLFGESAAAFKAVSLGIHLAVGLFIYLTLSILFRRDLVLQRHSAWFALAVTVVWLLHPLFASTVLYVVQRMAMLSALFVVIGLWAYLKGRVSIEEGRVRSGAVWLLLGVPLCTALAAFSKETGLLLPLLCGVVEWTHFVPPRGQRRPAAVRWFAGLFILAPVVLGSLYLLTHPDFILAGYENRPFNLLERLLTQSRVLFDYTGKLLLPIGEQFSLYRDDYRVSTGLFTPATTAAALAGWLVLIGLAIGLRKKIPGLAAGLGIFLVGHAMESTVFPLLIYFEHRNYLPGLGVFIAAISVLTFAGRAVSARMDRPGLVFGGALAGLLMALAFATYARALVWQSPMYLLEQSVEAYPDSRFGRMELAAQIMNQGPLADFEAAAGHYRHLQGLELPSTRMIGYLGEIAVTCFARGQAHPDDLEKAFEQQPETIQADLLKVIEELGRILQMRDCESMPMTDYADHLVAMADQTDLDPRRRTVWRVRFEAARLYADAERDRKALEQARLVWQTGQADLPVAMMMVGLHIRLGEFGAARSLLDEIEPQIPESDRTGRALVDEYRAAIEDGSRNSVFSPGIRD